MMFVVMWIDECGQETPTWIAHTREDAMRRAYAEAGNGARSVVIFPVDTGNQEVIWPPKV